MRRWRKQLGPPTNRGRFAAGEDQKVFALQVANGSQRSKIAARSLARAGQVVPWGGASPLTSRRCEGGVEPRARTCFGYTGCRMGCLVLVASRSVGCGRGRLAVGVLC
jgi:hypothetical protein